MRTGLLGARHLEHDVRLLAKRGVRPGGYGDQRYLEAPRIGENVAELDAFPRPGNGDDRVIAHDHAEVAVARLARVHEESGCAGGGEGRRHLLADVPALADAGDDHSASGTGQDGHRTAEGLAQLMIERRS